MGLLRNILLVAVVLVYVTVSCATGLFHSQACHLRAASAHTTDAISSNHPCSACMFSIASNSAKPSYGPALVITQSPVIPQFVPRLTIVHHDECGWSIISRAPPAIVTP
jgi:hypothetical protein